MREGSTRPGYSSRNVIVVTAVDVGRIMRDGRVRRSSAPRSWNVRRSRKNDPATSGDLMSVAGLNSSAISESEPAGTADAQQRLHPNALAGNSPSVGSRTVRDAPPGAR